MFFDPIDFAFSVAGGVLIGTSAGLFFLNNGKIAGISGMLASLLTRWSKDTVERALFLAGLPLGGLLYWLAAGSITISLDASPWTLGLAGLLVGIGTRLSNGCTSGHGICGIARLSPNSLAATAIFMIAAIVTTTLGHIL